MLEWKDLYSPENFRKHGHELVDQLAAYLEKVQQKEIAVHPWREPKEHLERWAIDFSKPLSDPSELFDQYLADSIHLHHPGYIGHQMSPVLPLTPLLDAVVSMLNNSTAIYEMGPSGVAMELKLVRWMASQIGFGPESGGFMTSGGQMGNLSALLAARQQFGETDNWNEGSKEKRFVVLVSEHAHYCIDRAVKIMGWGEEGLVKVPVDSNFKMDMKALKENHRLQIKNGKDVVAIVANACSTGTGTFDPLNEVADFCEESSTWFHIDGAHGASTVLSKRHKHIVQGIERADSVVWDPHKMMLVPALTTVVLFKNERCSFETFHQNASYLLGKSAEQEWFNLCHQTLECTKRNYAFRIYGALRLYGEAVFSKFIDHTFGMTKWFSSSLKEQGFDVPVEPESNIVCFRLPKLTDEAHSRIRQKLLKEGKYYICQADVAGKTHFRSTLMNPMTTKEDLKELINELLRLSKYHPSDLNPKNETR